MPCLPVIGQNGIEAASGAPQANGEEANTLMEIIKSKGLVRRQMVYGFEEEKNGTGEAIGSSVVTLARRNAFELVGLKRPVPVPAWRWKMSCWKLS
jgi:hypothetical protein